jgi:twitching motility protein PilT
MRRWRDDRLTSRQSICSQLQEAAQGQPQRKEQDGAQQVADLVGHPLIIGRRQEAAATTGFTSITRTLSENPASTPEPRAIEAYFQVLIDQGASDLILTAGAPPTMRKDGLLLPIANGMLTPEHTAALTREVLPPERYALFERRTDMDFSFNWLGRARFRVSAFRQRGSIGLVLRLIPYQIPTFEQLGLPPIVAQLAASTQGLILVTGPTGSGKSSTLAAMVNRILAARACHVITIEDPIEYVYRHQRSLVEQREVGADVATFAEALRAALRHTPDVLLVGEMRDLETISATITIAETGHLVLATLHTNDTTQAVDRMVDVFAAEQQQQVRVQLSNTLTAVIYQQLLPRKTGSGRVAAFEVLLNNYAVANLIKEGKTRQLRNVLETGVKDGMTTMERSLNELVRTGQIDHAVAAARALYPAELKSAASAA